MFNCYGYVYKIENLINHKFYIGKHKGKFSINYYGSGSIIQQAVKKYGKDNFKIYLLKYCYTLKELNLTEKFYIFLYNATNRKIGYNISFGGDGGNLPKWMYKEISRKKKKNKTNAGAKNSMYGKIPWNKGKKHSLETKQKISEKAKLRFTKKEERLKIGKINKGQKKSTKTIERQRSSIINTYKKHPELFNKYIFYTPYGIFNSIKEIQEKTNLSRDILFDCFKNENKKLVKINNTKLYKKEDIGKTRKELGWYKIRRVLS